MFSRFFVRRPVFAWVIAIVIMLGGLLALTTLSISILGDWLRDRLDPTIR